MFLYFINKGDGFLINKHIKHLLYPELKKILHIQSFGKELNIEGIIDVLIRNSEIYLSSDSVDEIFFLRGYDFLDIEFVEEKRAKITINEKNLLNGFLFKDLVAQKKHSLTKEIEKREYELNILVNNFLLLDDL